MHANVSQESAVYIYVIIFMDINFVDFAVSLLSEIFVFKFSLLGYIS